MNSIELKRRIGSRDRLLLDAEAASLAHDTRVSQALARGEVGPATAAAHEHDQQLRDLTEHLRIYQAELHAQADELQAGQVRIEALADRFMALFAGLPTACLLLTPSGEVLEHNAQASALMALDARPAGARFLHRLVQVDDYQARVAPAMQEALSRGRSARDGVQFMGVGGARFVGDLQLALLQGEAQPQLACIVIDRTQQLRDQQALLQATADLREREAFLAESARLARIGGWTWTLQPPSLAWSSQLREVLEMPADMPATIATLLEMCSEPDRPVLQQALAAAEQGEAFELEMDMRTARARPLRVRVAARAELQSGRVCRVRGVMQDITTQHRERLRLGELGHRLEMAHEACGLGVWEWRLPADGVATDARMRELLGRPEAAAATLGALLEPGLAPDDRLRLQAALHDTVSRQQALSLELAHKGSDGSQRMLRIVGRVQHEGSDGGARVVGCAWDCSAEREALRLQAAQEVAERTARAKDAFLARMSHELRTPLNAIVGFAELTSMDLRRGELQVNPRRVAHTLDAARHLVLLVNEVLDLSRIDSGKLVLEMRNVDLQRLVAEAVALVQALPQAAGLEFLNRCGPCIVWADELRLKQVLINLMSNAAKFNRPGGRIEVTVLALEGRWELSVADSGRGIAPEQLGGLFQPFNRLGAEHSGIEGSGMGLFVSKRIVEHMGGAIDIESQQGLGTTVRLRLCAGPRPGVQ